MTHLAAQSVTFAYRLNRLTDGRAESRLDHLALDAVSLEVVPGELLALVGANGAGKSTLLKALAGQIRPSHGTVLLDGKPISNYSNREIAKRVALMPQFESIESELSVRDVVRLGRVPHRGWWLPLSKEDESAIDEALYSMCLTDIQHQIVATLSGGQWRRTILARSLAQQSSILLLDEPTTGVDIKYQVEAMELFQLLTRHHKATVVLTLHDLNLASLFADRIALMKDGSMMFVGEPEKVLTSDNIQAAFGISATMIGHPTRSRPMIIPNV